MSDLKTDAAAVLMLGAFKPAMVASWTIAISLVICALLLACFSARFAIEGFESHANKTKLRVQNTLLQLPRLSMAKWTGGATRNARSIQSGSKPLNFALGTSKASFKKLNSVEGETERSFALLVQDDSGKCFLYIFNNIHGSIPVLSGVEQVPDDADTSSGATSSTVSGGIRP